jgi:rhamnulokinase/L-fuculokinase
MNFNSLYQLFYLAKYKPELLKRADKFLFMPDLLNYLLTGVKKSEYTIASTSQMLNPYERCWDKELLETVGIPTDILCDIIKPGTVLGNVTEDICTELGIDEAKVVAVGGHDTASAVVSVPTTEEDFVYISCGTWSLFGTELKEPHIGEDSLEYSYTNEGGYNNTIRFLTNIMGTWLIQESRRQWIKEGNELTFNDMEKMALASKPFQCFVDVDFADFGKPGNIPQRIKDFCARTGQYVPQTIGEVVRCIYESLAMKYRLALTQISECTGKSFDVLHLMGGGTKDGFLCELASQSLGIPVIAGPIEATALGNIVLQLIALGEIESISEGRRIIAENEKVTTFNEKHTPEWDEAYERFCKIVSK